MKKFLNAAILLTFLATFVGCVKDSGPNGNADLDHYTYTVQANQWNERGVFGQQGYQYFYEIPIPGITQTVLNTGTVMVYIQRDDLNMFYPLPVITNNTGYVNTIQNNVYLKMIEIFIEDTDFQTDVPGSMTFKVVVFNQLKSLPKSMDIRDYKQVEAFINK